MRQAILIYIPVHTEKKHTVQKEKDGALIAFVMGIIHEEAHTLFCCSLVFSLPTPSLDSLYMQLYLHVLLLEKKDKERGRQRLTFLAVRAQRRGEANKTTAKKCELLLIQYS